MADSEFNIIKPVEGLQTIQGLAPAKRRDERKRQRHAGGEHQEEPADEPADAEASPEANDDESSPSIDYCA